MSAISHPAKIALTKTIPKAKPMCALPISVKARTTPGSNRAIFPMHAANRYVPKRFADNTTAHSRNTRIRVFRFF
jgi:hypothetical protein